MLAEYRNLDDSRFVCLNLKENPKEKSFLSIRFNPDIKLDLGKERIIYSFRPNKISRYKIISKRKLIKIIASLPTRKVASILLSETNKKRS